MTGEQDRAAVQVVPLTGLGEIKAGSDLGPMLHAAIDRASVRLVRSDVLVVTQKIVSKARGRLATLSARMACERARSIAAVTGKDPRLVQLVLEDSIAVVRAAPGVLITRHRNGHVMANAGLDCSNIGPDREDDVLRLPQDCDAEAASMRDSLCLAAGVAPAVVIADSFGRPWRQGVVNVAVGAAGVPALIDRRGEVDRDGRRLEVTQVGFADLVASAAGLVMGEAREGVPAALLRGLAWEAPDQPAAALVRPLEEDLFR